MENMDEVLENTIKIMKVLDYSGLNFHSIQVIQINFGTRDLSPRPMSPCPKSPAAEMVAGDFFAYLQGLWLVSAGLLILPGKYLIT